ncbi:GspE/PulE family protein [Candidatus Margulisiibacteriota bacterium]
MIISELDKIINYGIDNNASDIHLEPKEEHLHLRYRIDGIMQKEIKIEKKLQQPLTSRIKILVNLDIAESRLPQDGRTNHCNVDLRVSTIPTLFGEKVVMRILKKNQTLPSLDELGMEKNELIEYRKLIAKRSGIILVSGPTGSGKTTTLYATLKELNAPQNNIVTIEDPIEYVFQDINQTQVNNKTGLTFARGLRSILRQDPDIIFIGEIRDLETAQIAVQAALTGHLVLATIHTQDAISSICRLIDMGIKNYLVSATLLGTVSQRLLRKTSGGRTAVFEVFLLNEEVKEIINKKYSKTNILREANFITLAQNAQELLKSNVVGKEEIYRVLGN